jgi:HK97 family phage portal protein
MFKEIVEFVRKAASSGAKLFTWPNRYQSEQLHATHALSGAYVTPEKSLQCSAVAASVRLLSETTAALPLHVYRQTGRSKALAADHPAYNLLHSQPNNFMTSFVFFQLAIAHVLLHGNSYSFIERDADGQPLALWPLRPEGMLVEAVDGQIRYRYMYGGTRAEFGFNEILHFKGLTLDGLMGLSVISMAREGIGLSLAQENHGAAIFRNNARPGGLLINGSPNKMSDAVQQELRESWQKGQGGMSQGKTAILFGADWKYQSMSMSSVDAQYLESRHFSVIEIARWFRVPPTLIGDMTRVSYASSESEMQLFAMHSLVPLCSNIEAELNAKLLPVGTPFFAKFDVNSIIRGDQSSRYTAYAQGLTAGFLSVADVRQAEGLEYIPGTDGLNRPANMLPHQQLPAEVAPVEAQQAEENSDGIAA